MNNGNISRTGERVLGIIGTVFNVITILLLVWLITSLSGLEGTAEFEEFQQDFMNDPMFEGSPEEAQMVMDFFVEGAGIIGWVTVAILVLSTIFAIVALMNLKKIRSAQLAGIFFILAGLLAGVMTPTSILFYIAAIMCFVRKPPMREDELYRKEDPVYHDDTVGRRSDSVNREDEAPKTRTDDMLRKEDARRDDDSPYRPL
ncbi:DUF4064 domain-containing protein [Planococcus sp. X10-3]|uniref:DUF4064 domain-containing protein n=1 Tax=Planococcus sp. X10-3 TaxID=3061240 RepID=UPI003BAECD5C